MKSKITFTISLGLLFQISVNAQEKETLNFASYLSEVREKNLNYAAQKYNVSMTEASILTAGLFPDPQLEMETSDNGVSKKMGYTIGTSVNWTLELGQKRKARIETAKNQAEYSKLQLQDFLRNLIADASVGYIEALKTKALVDIQKDSYLSMHQLATSDSIRYRLGAISQVTSRQSKLEASSLLNDLYKAESISRQSFSALFIFLGTDQQEKEISGNFKAFNRDFNSEDLILEAVNTRSDLLASKQNIHTAASLIKLEKANRIID
ncbi:MAG: TolC family protein, partial [Chryseobacterium sp.]|nr:TolC family protein [Chryseobacterium sp.]